MIRKPTIKNNVIQVFDSWFPFSGISNIQKGRAVFMRGPLIETESRRLRDEAKREYAIETALRILKQGKLTIEEISEITELSVAEIEQLKKCKLFKWEESGYNYVYITKTDNTVPKRLIR